MLSYDSPIPVPGQTSNAEPVVSLKATMPSPSSSRGLPVEQFPSAVAATQPPTRYNHHHIWLVTGPAGCGKSSVAEHLSNALSMPYIEGDSFHTPANVEKMRNGTPLTDADRWDWLTSLREESMRRIQDGADGVVLTCSALKRKYRDVIRVAAYYDPHLLIHFIYLDATEETLLQRVAARQGHYMGANMVHSQFAVLERPSADEKDVISIDVSTALDDVKTAATHRVQAILDADVKGTDA